MPTAATPTAATPPPPEGGRKRVDVNSLEADIDLTVSEGQISEYGNAHGRHAYGRHALQAVEALTAASK